MKLKRQTSSQQSTLTALYGQSYHREDLHNKANNKHHHMVRPSHPCPATHKTGLCYNTLISPSQVTESYYHPKLKGRGGGALVGTERRGGGTCLLLMAKQLVAT